MLVERACALRESVVQRPPGGAGGGEVRRLLGAAEFGEERGEATMGLGEEEEGGIAGLRGHEERLRGQGQHALVKVNMRWSRSTASERSIMYAPYGSCVTLT